MNKDKKDDLQMTDAEALSSRAWRLAMLAATMTERFPYSAPDVHVSLAAKFLRAAENYVAHEYLIQDAEGQSHGTNREPPNPADPVGHLELPTQVWRRLADAGYRTVGELTAATAETLACIPGIGPKSLIDINNAVVAAGLGLRPTPASGTGADAAITLNECGPVVVRLGKQLNVKSIREFTRFTEQEILALPRSGPSYLERLKIMLSCYGLTLRAEAKEV